MRPEPVPIEPTTERGSIHEEVVEVEAAALVGRYQDGETGALEVLHGRLERAIRKLLGRYELAQLPSTVTYQDLTQQGWVVLAEVAFRWRPTGRFLAYFFRSFPHEMDRYLIHARSGRRTQQVQVVGVPHDELVGSIERMTGRVSGVERSEPGLEQLASLPVEQRAAVVMRSVDGRSFDEIARALNVSRASAHRIYRRGIARLALELARP